MASSSSHHSSRSFDETSALFPIETNDEKPRLRSTAFSSSARPSAPLCEEKPIRPEGSARGANVALSRAAELDDPEAVRADETRTVRADERQQPLLLLASLCAHLCEAGRDDAERAYALTQARRGGVQHLRAGNADHGEVDVVRNRFNGCVGTNARNRLAAPVHGIRGAVEVGREHVAKQLAADRAATPRGADDGDALRREEVGERRGDRDVVAFLDALPGILPSH